MKAYVNYFRLRVITALQYRAAAVSGFFTQLFFGFIYLMVYLAFYESNSSSLLPMNFQNLVNYLWISQAFFALTYPYEKDQSLMKMIKNGNLAYELVRPQNFYLKFYIKMIAKKLVNAGLRCGPLIIVASLLPDPLKLTFPSIKVILVFIISLLLSCLLVSALSMLIHIVMMFTIDSKGIVNIYGVIAETFMGMIVPLPFFPAFLRKIANVLPFRFISDFPFRLFSGDIALNGVFKLICLSLMWIVITNVVNVFLSNLALKKAVIQGG